MLNAQVSFHNFSLLFSSSTLAFSNDDEESTSSQPPSPKESEAGRTPAATGSNSLDSPKESEAGRAFAASESKSSDSIIDKEIKIVVKSGFFEQSGSKRSPRDPFETPITMRFSSIEERAWVQTNIGTLYCNALNNTTDFNFTEAMRWFKKAAAQKYAEAQYSIGMLHDYGLGVPPNHTKAMKWYLRAVTQKHATVLACFMTWV